MAKIQEEVIVIKLSKLIKDGSGSTESLISAETIEALEQVVQELVGQTVIVEVEAA